MYLPLLEALATGSSRLQETGLHHGFVGNTFGDFTITLILYLNTGYQPYTLRVYGWYTQEIQVILVFTNHIIYVYIIKPFEFPLTQTWLNLDQGSHLMVLQSPL